SVDALRDTSPLPAGSPGSVPRSSGSVDPATPEDRVAAGWPTEPAGMIPAARVRVPATTSSYSAGLRSGPPLATGSCCACGPEPCGAGATAVAADPGSPNSAPKSAGHVLPAVTSG